MSALDEERVTLDAEGVCTRCGVPDVHCFCQTVEREWHEHGRRGHAHAYPEVPHSHFLRAVCTLPECASFATHDIHQTTPAPTVEASR